MGWIMEKFWFDSRQVQEVSSFTLTPRPSLFLQRVRGSFLRGVERLISAAEQLHTSVPDFLYLLCFVR